MVSTIRTPFPQQPQQRKPASYNNTAAPTTPRPASPLLASPFRRKTMSITQTYYLAHKARAKLSAEAQRPDHNLRKLVGSANLLDSLMLELADAEREQESWFNQSVRASTPPKAAPSQDRRVQWADTVIEEPEEDWDAEDASDSSDDEYDDEDDDDMEMADVVSLTRVPSKAAPEYFDDEEEDEEEDYEHLSLTRSPSHTAAPPTPDLDHDYIDDDLSEDESMPPSPPTAPALPSFEKNSKQDQQAQQSPATSPTEQVFYNEAYYLPPRNPARLVTAISVY